MTWRPARVAAQADHLAVRRRPGRCLLRYEGYQCCGPRSRTRREQEEMMRVLGYVVVIEMVGLGAVLGVLAVKGLPDARRYIEMRKM